MTTKLNWLSEAEEDASLLSSLLESKQIVERVLADDPSPALAADCRRIIARLEGEIAAMQASIDDAEREQEYDRLICRYEYGRIA